MGGLSGVGGGQPKRAASAPQKLGGAAGAPNPLMEAEVKCADFFYMDRFVLLACGGALRMYSFQLSALDERLAVNDLKRLSVAQSQQGGGKYRLVEDWGSSAASSSSSSSSAAGGGGGGSLGSLEAVAVTSFACCNSMLSRLVILAATNRSIQVLDAGSGQVARVIRDAHARPAHFVALPRPSALAPLDPNHYDTFATLALDGVCALWDLRADRCVARLKEHTNKRDPTLTAAFSPCLRYLACGSEDRRALLYDLRTCKAVEDGRGRLALSGRAAGHTDSVSQIAFNPRHPQLATGCSDGLVRFFTDG